MTDEKYGPRHIAQFFGEYGEREWERLDTDAPAWVSVYLHRRYLRRFIKRGSRVLEVGAGPGRFTIELARLGAHIIVGDVSAVQLELNRKRWRRPAAKNVSSLESRWT